jgi:hypothetical protein
MFFTLKRLAKNCLSLPSNSNVFGDREIRLNNKISLFNFHLNNCFIGDIFLLQRSHLQTKKYYNCL